jgi:hypothetical protein
VVWCAEQTHGEEFWLGMENVVVVLETFMWLSMDFFFFCWGFVLDSAGRVCVAMRAEWAGLLLQVWWCGPEW